MTVATLRCIPVADIMRCQWPGLPQEQVLSSIKRLGEIFAS